MYKFAAKTMSGGAPPWLIFLFLLCFLASPALAQDPTTALPGEDEQAAMETEANRTPLFRALMGVGLTKPNRALVGNYTTHYLMAGFSMARNPGFNLIPTRRGFELKKSGFTWGASALYRGLGPRNSFSQGLVNAQVGPYLLLNSSGEPSTFLKFAVGLQGGFLKLPDISVRSHLYQVFREGIDPALDLIEIDNRPQALLQGQLQLEMISLCTVGNDLVMTRIRLEFGFPLAGRYEFRGEMTPSDVVTLNPNVRGYQAIELGFGVPGQNIELGVGGLLQQALQTDDKLNIERIYAVDLRAGILFGGWKPKG